MNQFKKAQNKKTPVKKQPILSNNSKSSIIPLTNGDVVPSVSIGLSIVSVMPEISIPTGDVGMQQSINGDGQFFILNIDAPFNNHQIEIFKIIASHCDVRSLQALICATKSLHKIFHDTLVLKKEQIENSVFVFDDWYQDNVITYSQRKNSLSIQNKDVLQFTNQVIIPQFYGYAEIFLNVVFGLGYQEVSTKHFNTFLRQAGGQKVKMTQNGYLPIHFKDQSVETHYVLPNLSNLSGALFSLCTVHQPHSASIPFPKKTLYSFLRRDLAKAGYEQCVKKNS